MRILLSFVLATCLLVAGLYILYLEFFITNVIVGRMLIMGSVFTFIGAAWLWADFISPLLRGKEVG